MSDDIIVLKTIDYQLKRIYKGFEKSITHSHSETVKEFMSEEAVIAFKDINIDNSLAKKLRPLFDDFFKSCPDSRKKVGEKIAKSIIKKDGLIKKVTNRVASLVGVTCPHCGKSF
ncbi:MAG: hypothetical protein WC570_00570 [Patescibacteria group bacterium]